MDRLTNRQGVSEPAKIIAFETILRVSSSCSIFPIYLRVRQFLLCIPVAHFLHSAKRGHGLPSPVQNRGELVLSLRLFCGFHVTCQCACACPAPAPHGFSLPQINQSAVQWHRKESAVKKAFILIQAKNLLSSPPSFILILFFSVW